MKITIISLILILICSCSSIEKISFNDTKMQFIEEANKGYNNIDKFFIKGIKNNIIIDNLKVLKPNLFFVEKEHKRLSDNKIKTLFIANIGINSVYFDVIWKKSNGFWKIYSVEGR